MRSDWRRLCKAPDLKVSGDGVEVRFADERRHHVLVHDEGDHFRLEAVVVRRAAVEKINDPALLAWRRNRVTQLVGFRQDRRGRLIGEAWVPKIGLSGEELAFYVRKVASECDRLEYLLTGKDEE